LQRVSIVLIVIDDKDTWKVHCHSLSPGADRRIAGQNLSAKTQH